MTRWMWKEFPFSDKGAIGLSKTSIGFSDFVWETFGFLCSGQKLVVVGEDVKNPNKLISLLESQCVSHLVLVFPCFNSLINFY